MGSRLSPTIKEQPPPTPDGENDSNAPPTDAPMAQPPASTSVSNGNIDALDQSRAARICSDGTIEIPIIDDDDLILNQLSAAVDGALSLAQRNPKSSSLPVAVVREIDEGVSTPFIRPNHYIRYSRLTLDEVHHDDDTIDYELDSEDERWLEDYNSHPLRKANPKLRISEDDLEFALDCLEKQAYFTKTSLLLPDIEVEEKNCTVCQDGTSDDTNQIIFCDGCNIGVHQKCYGVQLIPEGEWKCLLCEKFGSLHNAERQNIRCIFCGKRNGAMKLTERNEFTHVQCALWLPEMEFEQEDCGGVAKYKSEIPAWRWGLLCSICGKKRGAPIVCMKDKCKLPFHVTCGQKKWFAILNVPHESDPNKVVHKAWCKRHIPQEYKEYQRYQLELEKISKRRKKKQTKALKLKLKALLKEAQSPENITIQMIVRRAIRQIQSSAMSAVESTGGNQPVEPEEDVFPQINEELLKCCGGLTLTRAISSILPTTTTQTSLRLAAGNGRVILPSPPANNNITEYTLAKIYRYWANKRVRRRGLALLRRFQPTISKAEAKIEDLSSAELLTAYQYLRLLRQNLERARIILELVRKREKLKLERLRAFALAFELEHLPVMADLRYLLNYLREEDTNSLFEEPIPNISSPHLPDSSVPPMCFRVIEDKLNHCQYSSVEEFWTDLFEIPKIATTYCNPDAVYYQEASRMERLMQQLHSSCFAESTP